MLKTTLRHFILDHALNVMFDGFAKNFQKAPKNFINNIKRGDIINDITVNFNGYLIECDSAMVWDVVTNGGKYQSMMLILPLGIVRITNLNDTDDEYVSIIEHSMIWLEEIPDDPVDACKGEFATPIAIDNTDIIKDSR